MTASVLSTLLNDLEDSRFWTISPSKLLEYEISQIIAEICRFS